MEALQQVMISLQANKIVPQAEEYELDSGRPTSR